MSQKVRVFGLKTLFWKRFTVRSTTRTLIIDKTDHSAFTAILTSIKNRWPGGRTFENALATGICPLMKFDLYGRTTFSTCQSPY